jgi:hypothetical protein
MTYGKKRFGKRVQIEKNFYLDELVPLVIYRKYGKHSYMFIDERLPGLLQFTREFFDSPIILNTWWNFGSRGRTWSGYRTPNPKQNGIHVGAKYSQHKTGRAADLVFPVLTKKGMSYEDIRNVIRANHVEFMKHGLTTIERSTPTWLHMDMRWMKDRETLYEVNYK